MFSLKYPLLAKFVIKIKKAATTMVFIETKVDIFTRFFIHNRK